MIKINYDTYMQVLNFKKLFFQMNKNSKDNIKNNNIKKGNVKKM